MDAHRFVMAVSLVGTVIVVSTLLSGALERTGLPFVAVFLALGAALGPAGVGALQVTLETPVLRVLATLSLVLVLFTDAISLDLAEVRRHARLALVVLGPGTLLSAALVALAAWKILGLPFPAAAILGGALASTDPVLLRGILRRRDIPDRARLALRLESALNDVVLLPIVVAAMPFLARESAPMPATFARLALGVLVLGPLAGILVAVIAIALLDFVRKRAGVRRDYESIYSLGIAFTAYAAAEAVHGSGFLAAFAAGVTIVATDVELCDCFVEYGETTAELALLLTFVLFGGSLIWRGFAIADASVVAFVIVALLVRPVAFGVSLAGLRMPSRERALIAWFGPRGLSSLLLVLLPVFEGIPGAERLFSLCSLVVIASIVIHGGTPPVLSRLGLRRERRALTMAAPSPSPATPDAPRDEPKIDPSTITPPPTDADSDALRMTLAELTTLESSHAPLLVVDVRSDRSVGESGELAVGVVRAPLDNVVEEMRRRAVPDDTWIVAMCA